ncbi:glycoside hydrolase family 26 protein [Streptomyces sp. NPDC090303]|uniref:glycoside hydrolase family 26 protein n=1 Tax=Streptomyces sp. NPDC090303 TaxID=3365960 RepID=UPI0038227CE6
MLRRPYVPLLVTGLALACGMLAPSGTQASEGPHPGSRVTATTVAGPAAAAPTLIHPQRKYLGVFREGAPSSMRPVEEFGQLTGKQPNLVLYYAGWGDGFHASGVRNAWNRGALTVVSWEPHGTTLAAVARGDSDAYVRRYAAAVRTLGIPVAISFADEMNGDWEDWGTTSATPEEFVAAWRRVHRIFDEAGADRVIWTWSPNITNAIGDSVRLADYDPGDAYVDWTGIVGYFTDWDPHTFDELFGPTIDEVRALSRRPLLILETGAVPGARRAEHIRELCEGIRARPDVIGFSWFDKKARADWRLETEGDGIAAFRSCVADERYGFDVRGLPFGSR